MPENDNNRDGQNMNRDNRNKRKNGSEGDKATHESGNNKESGSESGQQFGRKERGDNEEEGI